MSETFDQQLYDAAYNERPNVSDLGFGEGTTWIGGYLKGIEMAARLSAARRPQPTDDELGHIAYRAMLNGELIPWDQFREGGWIGQIKSTAEDFIRLGIAVRAALTAPVPQVQIPDGWTLISIKLVEIESPMIAYTAHLITDLGDDEAGIGPTWQEALAAACERAGGTDER